MASEPADPVRMPPLPRRASKGKSAWRGKKGKRGAVRQSQPAGRTGPRIDAEASGKGRIAAPPAKTARKVRAAVGTRGPFARRADAAAPPAQKPDAPPPADRARAEALHADLQGRVTAISRDLFGFVELVETVLAERSYEPLGYSDPAEYFDVAVGYRWRSVRRLLAIAAGLRRIADQGERAAVRGQLEAAGVHKAGVLAPVLGLEGAPWQVLVDKAPGLSEADLAIAVARAAKSRPRGRAAREHAGLPAGERESAWLRATVRQFQEDGTRAEIRCVFSAGRCVLGTDSDLAVLLALAQECKTELYHEARARGWTPPVAESGADVNQETTEIANA